MLTVAAMFGTALYGVGIVRSSLFAMFFSAYVLLSLPAAIGVGVWLGRKPRQEEPGPRELNR